MRHSETYSRCKVDSNSSIVSPTIYSTTLLYNSVTGVSLDHLATMPSHESNASLKSSLFTIPHTATRNPITARSASQALQCIKPNHVTVAY